MTLEVKHRDAEYNAKAHLRQQYQLHHTAIDKYEKPMTTAYGAVVYDLAAGIGSYVLQNEGKEAYRYYINTTGIDWQQRDS